MIYFIWGTCWDWFGTDFPLLPHLCRLSCKSTWSLFYDSFCPKRFPFWFLTVFLLPTYVTRTFFVTFPKQTNNLLIEYHALSYTRWEIMQYRLLFPASYLMLSQIFRRELLKKYFLSHLSDLSPDFLLRRI